jgi:Cu+-exporting ATPase
MPIEASGSAAMIPELYPRVRRAILLTLPVAVFEMSRHLTGWPAWHGAALVLWQAFMAVATTVLVFGPGWPLLHKGWRSYRHGRLNMFSMIAPGVLITYFFSLFALVVPGMFPDSFRVHGHVPVYFETAAMITTLVLIGQYLEARAERHTGDALEGLARLAPTRTCIIRDGVEQWTGIDQVATGDLIQLRAGDRVPVDGPVVRGEASIDESMLTGEPMPQLKSTGQRIVGGTLLREGSLVMRAEHVGNQTVLARIIEMVRAAQESKAPIQRIADRVTVKLVPVVLALSALTLVIWWRIGPQPALWYGMIHAVTVLMITCPCALGLATPVSIMTGLGRGAKDGILIKQAASLERLASVDTLVLDKTGTLTTGRPILHACIPSESGAENHVLKLAASLEHYSHHPLAGAVVEGARHWGVATEPVSDFRSETGGGVAGKVGAVEVMVGRASWLQGQAVSGFEHLDSMARTCELGGRTVAWVAAERRIAGILVIADELKPRAALAIQALKKRGLRLLMMTGDNRRTAEMIGRQLKLDDVFAEVQPGDKSRHVQELRRAGSVVAMAGDGINDAPALASADVGISVGTGTDVAVASGDINLMHGDIMGLVHAIDLSRAVMRTIRQNLFFAFAYNAVMIPVAAGALYPWTGWMLTPMLASAAMSASSLTVIGNALRLRRLHFPTS